MEGRAYEDNIAETGESDVEICIRRVFVEAKKRRDPSCQLPDTHSLFLSFSPLSQASSCLGLLVFQAYLNV